jgi:hypothetical protein
MKVCPTCNEAALDFSATFCYKDGTALVERNRHSCGRELSKFDKFCPGCGADLSAVPAKA